MNSRQEYFSKFLKFFWLRPESALMLAVRAEKYASTMKLMGDYNIDVSCGDGVFSFITMGGELSEDSDMYRSLDHSSKREGNFDTYDSYDSSYFIKVDKKPKKNYNLGTDWKENLINKAAHLSYYEDFIVHDNNNIFPIGSEKGDYIYSNSTYWVKNFEEHIFDLVRMLKIGGHLVLEIKTKDILNMTSKNYAPFMGNNFHNIIDAGRAATWEGLKSIEEYEYIFSKLNIKVVSKSPVYGGKIMQIWDIGLRPIFSPLAKMVDSLTPENRVDIKGEWCNVFNNLLKDYVGEYSCSNDDAVEWLFILEKK